MSVIVRPGRPAGTPAACGVICSRPFKAITDEHNFPGISVGGSGHTHLDDAAVGTRVFSSVVAERATVLAATSRRTRPHRRA